MTGPSDRIARCAWVPPGDALYRRYHDEEWGTPSRDDRHLFEMLVLEGAQAGLSWATILRKREAFRAAFQGFDPVAIARFDARDVERLLGDASIVRNRAKIEAAIANARATLDVRARFGSLSEYVWRFVDGRPVVNRRRSVDEIPAETPASRAISAALRRDGFRFVGPTICYAFMQAVGMVNDHTLDCFRWAELAGEEPRQRPDPGAEASPARHS